MRQIELPLIGWTIVDAMVELRIWLDHNNCVPLSFEITKLPDGGVFVRMEFDRDSLAEAFERDFAR